MWTSVGGAWQSVDSTFSAGTSLVVEAVITSPANGATNVTKSQIIHWTSVPGAQAYYLYVGTTQGAKDIIDTAETQSTASWLLGEASHATLYARLWTKYAGAWRYVDSTFSTSDAECVDETTISEIIYPIAGDLHADLTPPIQWTPVANAQSYYLYVGTSFGAKDVVNTGEIQATSYQASSLPLNVLLYARIFTKVGGQWASTDTTFVAVSTTAPAVATLVFPTDGAVDADLTQVIRWITAGSEAIGYYLWLGSTPGTKGPRRVR